MDQFFFSRALSSILKEWRTKSCQKCQILSIFHPAWYKLFVEANSYVSRDLHNAHTELPYELKTYCKSKTRCSRKIYIYEGHLTSLY